ncbi:hypothetical protein L6J37_15210 [Photobacterium sp. WH77]|uniref:hypothetical protein n=1 Tax=Photobacterium sp. WH77 TaxID=2913413 RepID=UPI001ED9EAFD|nr:hypothetical protein [Photobacterium sp. WH77]MCG2838180.1 hypothetical protein [Photobacterium sp. WH77]
MNFQVVGAGSAYNRPGQHQRTKRHFWVLFWPKKSIWRAQENAEVCSEVTRDIPLHIPALPDENIEVKTLWVKISLSKYMLAAKRFRSTAFTSAQANPTPGKNSWMNFQVVGAGSAYNRPGQHQRTKRHFWVLFWPKKSIWRAQENAEVCSEVTRDIPLHIPALPDENIEVKTLWVKISLSKYMLAAKRFRSTAFTSAQANPTPGKNSWMNFQVVGAGSAYNRPGQHQRTKRHFWILFWPKKSIWRA